MLYILKIVHNHDEYLTHVHQFLFKGQDRVFIGYDNYKNSRKRNPTTVALALNPTLNKRLGQV